MNREIHFMITNTTGTSTMTNLPLIGQQAPEIIANCVLPNGEIIDNHNFLESTAKMYRIVFFYPLDFTFVCPSELIALNKRLSELAALNTAVLTVSIDSVHAHSSWRNTNVSDGGIGTVGFTMAADTTHSICQSYACQSADGTALRATYIINPEGTICSQQINSAPIGRNVDEYVRLIQALQFHAQYGEVCPAGWNLGQQGMEPTAKGVAKYLTENAGSL
jgi:peroxiredoxin 2/4